VSEVTLHIDGVEARVPAGSTVLEAARDAGIDIPALCYDPRLEPFTACWLCVVEVEGRPGPVPACTAQVAEGMVVRTRSEDITALRRLALELLLSQHCGDCVAPCQQACPAGIDIQGFIALIADRRHGEALELIREANPFPAVCGRVCPRPCEDVCRRTLVDEPVAINWLKRFVADLEREEEAGAGPSKAPASGRRIAVIGAGPAGLTAAHFLARRGHSVTVFEAGPEPGGMLRYGIPAYRLPREVLKKEVDRILALGVDLRVNQKWGKNFTLSDLRAQGYEAIFVGIGAGLSSALGVPGEHLPGVSAGVQLLAEVASGKDMALAGPVVVVGGGNTAIDAARTARRLGADEVTLLYRRSRAEMPAHKDEVEEAEAEGVRLELLAAPVRFLGDGRVEAVECIRMTLGEPDASGRRRPVPLPGSEFTISARSVILALGQQMDAEPAKSEGDLALSRSGYIEVAEGTWQVTGAACFAGGDCTGGAMTVVEAIGAGRRAAESIDRYLAGEALSEPEPLLMSEGELEEIDPAEYAGEPRKLRQPNPLLPVAERLRGFAPVELGLDEAAAVAEADRCLACGCDGFQECLLRKLAEEYGADPKRFGGAHRKLPAEVSHPLISRDPGKCILCGRCVRVCAELTGVGALGFVGRGSEAEVKALFSGPSQREECAACSLCLGSCPTGALTAVMSVPKPARGETASTLTTCGYCGVGCTVELHRQGRRLVRASAPFEAEVNRGSLCIRGLLGWQAAYSGDRVGAPEVRCGDRLEETSWDAALSAAAEGLRRTLKAGSPDDVALVVAPWWPTEALWLAQKLGREVLATENLLALAPSLLGEETSDFPATGCYDDLDEADVIFIVGVALTQKYPVLAVRARQALRRGATLGIVGRQKTGLEDKASALFRPRRGESAAVLLDALAGGRRGAGAGEVRRLWQRSPRRLVVTDLDSMDAPERAAGAGICRRFGGTVRLLTLRGEANAQGAATVGFVSGERGRRLLARIQAGHVRAVLLLGLASTDGSAALHLARKPEFLVVVDARRSPLAESADVLFPGAFWMEDEGTVVNPEGRVQRLVLAVPPPGGRANWEVIAALADALGARWQYGKVEEVFAECAPAVRGARPQPWRARVPS